MRDSVIPWPASYFFWLSTARKKRLTQNVLAPSRKMVEHRAGVTFQTGFNPMNDFILCLANLVLLLWVLYLKKKLADVTAELEFLKNPKTGMRSPREGTRQSETPGMRSFDIK